MALGGSGIDPVCCFALTSTSGQEACKHGGGGGGGFRSAYWRGGLLLSPGNVYRLR